MSAKIDPVEVAERIRNEANTTRVLQRNVGFVTMTPDEALAIAKVVIASERVEALHKLHIEFLDREDDADAMVTYADFVEAMSTMRAALKGE